MLDNILIVSVGGAGKQILNKVIELQNYAYNCCSIMHEYYVNDSRAKYKISYEHNGNLYALGKQIEGIIKKYEIVILISPMGGDSGIKIAPIVANICKENNILCISLCTKPFKFEGEQRQNKAITGINSLSKESASFLIYNYERIMQTIDLNLGINDIMRKLDSYLANEVLCIINGIKTTMDDEAILNVDINDLKTILKNGGLSFAGNGHSQTSGLDAAKKALYSPLFEVSVDDAKDMLILIKGSTFTSLSDICDIIEIIRSNNENLNIIYGLIFEKGYQINEYDVWIMASGFDALASEYGEANIVEKIIRNNSNRNISLKDYNKINNDIISNNKKYDNISFGNIKYEFNTASKILRNSYCELNIFIYEEQFADIIHKVNTNAVNLNSMIDSDYDVMVILNSNELTINKNSLTQKWNGKFLVYKFIFYVPINYDKNNILFDSTVYLNGIPIANLDFIIDIEKE